METSHYSASPHSAKYIYQFVKLLREQFNMNDRFCVPVVEIIEHVIPELDPRFNFEYLEPDQMPPNVYAYYNPIENKMSIREDVYNRACEGAGRDRFTLAHEIGHYFLHKEDVKLCRNAPSTASPIYQDPEWQANTFASMLLMFPDAITGMTPQEISKKCQTSLSAAKIAKKKSRTLC